MKSIFLTTNWPPCHSLHKSKKFCSIRQLIEKWLIKSVKWTQHFSFWIHNFRIGILNNTCCTSNIWQNHYWFQHRLMRIYTFICRHLWYFRKILVQHQYVSENPQSRQINIATFDMNWSNIVLIFHSNLSLEQCWFKHEGFS